MFYKNDNSQWPHEMSQDDSTEIESLIVEKQQSIFC